MVTVVELLVGWPGRAEIAAPPTRPPPRKLSPKKLLLLITGVYADRRVIRKPMWIADTGVPRRTVRATPQLSDRYRDVAGKIVATAHADRGAYAKLEHLTDHIGHRLSGSPGARQGVRVGRAGDRRTTGSPTSTPRR